MDKYINFIILMKWLKWLKKTASSKRQSFYDNRLTHMLVLLRNIIFTTRDIAMLAGYLSEGSQANLQSKIQYRQGL